MMKNSQKPNAENFAGLLFIIVSVFFLITAIFGKISLEQRPLLRREKFSNLHLFIGPLVCAILSTALGIGILERRKTAKTVVLISAILLVTVFCLIYLL